MQGNITIAVIILVLFTVLGIVAFFIMFANAGFSRMNRRAKEVDEEEGGSSRSSGSRR